MHWQKIENPDTVMAYLSFILKSINWMILFFLNVLEVVTYSVER